MDGHANIIEEERKGIAKAAFLLLNYVHNILLLLLLFYKPVQNILFFGEDLCKNYSHLPKFTRTEMNYTIDKN